MEHVWGIRFDPGTKAFMALPAVGGQGQAEREARALPEAVAAGRDLAAVEFHHLPRDRQAQAEAPVRTRHRAVGLAEPVEHVGQEFCVDARAAVGHADLHSAAGPHKLHLHAPAARRRGRSGSHRRPT